MSTDVTRADGKWELMEGLEKSEAENCMYMYKCRLQFTACDVDEAAL